MLEKDEEIKLLKQLCSENDISLKKVLKLIEIEKDFELKDRRHGIYEALNEVIKSNL